MIQARPPDEACGELNPGTNTSTGTRQDRAGDSRASAVSSPDILVAVMAILGMFMGVLALSITEQAPFLPIASEVISAVGTVGLSLGLTEELSESGRMIVIMLMFVGRLCPLTMAFFVGSARPAGKSRSRADIQIG